MPLLVGRHVNRIDRKGRVSVPKQFRDALARDGATFAGIYVYPSLSAPAIEACSEEFLYRVSESIGDLPFLSPDQSDLATALLGEAQALPFDPEGRIILPAKLTEYAGIDGGEAEFVGRGQWFQIWNPRDYQVFSQEARERVRTRGATLPLRREGGHDRT